MIDELRRYSLSDRVGEIRPTARHELLVLQYYPEDEASRRQAVSIIHDEYRRWTECNGENYEESSLAHTLSEALNPSAGQRLTCGLVGLAQLGLKSVGYRPSVNLANEVVQEFAASVGSIEVQTHTRGSRQKTLKIRLVSDAADIRKAWSKYRSIAHLLSAEVIASEHLDLGYGFGWDFDAMACYFNTLAACQAATFELPGVKSWKPWLITCDPPYDPAEYPILDGRGTMATLFDPWIKSGKAEAARRGRRFDPNWDAARVRGVETP
ncbi:hypothetical protein [Gymnodinialimonas ulvae]|uniref:hypothetical protein n=1 Tax=Gymnodinialimonas ulvae TaxID=3126504 RepID=UPI003094FB72